MFRQTVLACLVLLLEFAYAPCARAFSLNVDTQQLAPDQRGLLTLPAARTPGHLILDASLVLGFGARSVATGGGDGYNQASYDETLTLQIGLGDRAALALSLPASIVTVHGDNENGSRHGLGNPALDARLRLLGPERLEDTRALAGALALRGVLHAPIDRESPFYADRALRTELDLLGELSWLGVRAWACLATVIASTGNLTPKGGSTAPCAWAEAAI